MLKKFFFLTKVLKLSNYNKIPQKKNKIPQKNKIHTIKVVKNYSPIFTYRFLPKLCESSLKIFIESSVALFQEFIIDLKIAP